MRTYDRRAFLKQSAMLTATLAAGRVFPPSVIAGAAPARQEGRGHPFFVRAKNRPEVIAHRGGDLEWPGETMFAMRQAMKAGADVLEMDVYRAQNGKPNGELVLMHDDDVKKTTGLECGPPEDCEVNKFTVARLQQLNAARNWPPGRGRPHPYEKEADLTFEVANDLRVPTLEEVFKEFPDARMVVEMKKANSSPVERLAELIQEYGMGEKVLVASFHEPFMTAFRQRLPKVATSLSLSLQDAGRLFRILLRWERSSANDPARPDAIQIPHQLVNPLAVRMARRSNLVIHAWTPNSDRALRRMRTAGVDGIITDRPTRLLTLLGRAKTG